MFETRIYFSFENNDQLTNIIDFVSGLFEGFTIYETLGYWKGIKEVSRIIEIISERCYDIESYAIVQIASYIKVIANQESVLLTSKSINMEFV